MAHKTTPLVRLALGYVVALCVLSCAGLLLFHNALQFHENRKWVTHTRDVLQELQRFENKVQDAESGQRGYLLTGDEEYLRTYDSSITEASQVLDRVQTLTQDNPRQQAAIVACAPILRLGFRS